MPVDSWFAETMREMGRPALDEFLNLYPLALRIERLKDVANDANGEGPDPNDDDNWELFAEANAKSVTQSTQEYFPGWTQRIGGQLEVFEMLYVAGLTSEMRVVFEGRKFNIAAAPYSPGERKVYTVLACVELEPRQ